MKKIAYIELDTHAEIALAFMEVTEDSDQFEVDYFLSRKILDQLQISKNSHVFESDSKKIVPQLAEKNYDLVIIGTVHRYFNTFLTIANLYNTIVIVHNLNFSHLSKFRLFKNIFKKETVYRLKLLINEGLMKAPSVYKTVKKAVLDEDLLEKNLIHFPLFYNHFLDKPNNNLPVVVIPGMVSQQRRNYDHVLEVLSKYKNPLFAVFLGKAEKRELELLMDFQKKKPEHIQIQFFNRKLTQLEFDEWMKRANFLWCPLRMKTEFFSAKEIYGKTKMSGNTADAIKYGKYAIFPKSYHAKLPFIVQETQDLEMLFESLKNKCAEFEGFQKQEIKIKLEDVLKSLI